VSSPLRRAHRTAEILGDELGLGPVEVTPELIERAVGPWSGLTFEEIEAGWPGALDRRDWPEGFEDDDTLLARALSAIDRLAARFPEGDILAVTHGGVLHALERHAGLVRGRFPNLSGRWVTMTDGRLRLGDRLDLVAEPTGGRPRALQGTTGAAPHPAVEPA
jgi:broad specificity phosphatase PhoE